MMNRDEAVQKLATVGHLSMAHAEDLYDSIIPKPVVPKYVADWYEENKDVFNEEIGEYLANWDDVGWDNFERWMSTAYENEAITALINMHQFGYEVEDGPRYMVRIKGIDDRYDVLNYGIYLDEWTIDDADGAEGVRTTHTRKELEANGFGWVFSCEGVEVKEVDDGND
ncbi:DUF1642 domain-containing protein [Streptococcus vestibularis]|uniref:DUF1642 domain-containing protein n=1 Tax=Streptococcus vestibularis TaxID=1343 RepID=UPI001BECA49C|nr:DUF1642 domain-containing protein [Streptococcus vestibularis]